MTDTANGNGGATDAVVSIADLQDELRRRVAEDEAEAPKRRVANAREKVERAQRDLAQAKDELHV